jgi:D-alanyl-D-alanine dipeptidase
VALKGDSQLFALQFSRAIPAMNWLLLIAATILLSNCSSQPRPSASLPQGFVSVSSLNSGIQLDIRYYTSNNFIGRPVAGYFRADCILTEAAAQALLRAQALADAQGYALKVYDCYRPQQAVTDFVSWAADPDDTLLQHRFYPVVPKDQLFARGYIAELSGHSRGSTVDLTLVPAASRQPQIDPFANRYDCRAALPLRYPDNSLDMGTGYDCFDELSHTDNSAVGALARRNRDLLRAILTEAGFSNYAQEWWHYTLDHEPYPERYFDFPVR